MVTLLWRWLSSRTNLPLALSLIYSDHLFVHRCWQQASCFFLPRFIDFIAVTNLLVVANDKQVVGCSLIRWFYHSHIIHHIDSACNAARRMTDCYHSQICFLLHASLLEIKSSPSFISFCPIKWIPSIRYGKRSYDVSSRKGKDHARQWSIFDEIIIIFLESQNPSKEFFTLCLDRRCK